MTVYEFLIHAARNYSGMVNGGKTEEIRIDLTHKSIWSDKLCIMRNGKLLMQSVRLEKVRSASWKASSTLRAMPMGRSSDCMHSSSVRCPTGMSS